MADFPTLKPAFTVQIKNLTFLLSQQVQIDPPYTIGSLNVVPMIGGTLKSEPGFSPAVDSTFAGTGNDYIRASADGKQLSLDAHGVVKTKDDALLYLHYTGNINVTEAEAAVFSGKAADGPTPWGNLFTNITFEAGDERYKSLEGRVFVGQGRFIIQKDKPGVVEYKACRLYIPRERIRDISEYESIIASIYIEHDIIINFYQCGDCLLNQPSSGLLSPSSTSPLPATPSCPSLLLLIRPQGDIHFFKYPGISHPNIVTSFRLFSLQRCAIFFPIHTSSNIKPTTASVEITATNTLKAFNTLTLHPNDIVLISHFSFDPNGHIFPSRKEEKMGNRDGFGTHVED
ncbi:conserved hypothetical protein [Paecilomyces variotii No. 5]|uniref:Uncharacterized protein n=1 Tax=Byssochlamys spectabilis (strain No. 5 / NBRC 109023) TaxID=1356009 RepID=V5FKF4_BYSSN|nr:conserved hypothetical protein [Paecilomyces variotii No. 5]